MSDLALAPRRLAQVFPVRPDPVRPGALARLAEETIGRQWRQIRAAPRSGFARAVLAQEPVFAGLGSRELRTASREAAAGLRSASRRRRAGSLVGAFALVREAAFRRLGFRLFPCQILAARCLVDGAIAEAATGEGKTAMATLAAGTAALGGAQVHVITANDYLARRDAASMGPIYADLGLTVGVVAQGMAPEERRAAYACDVVYAAGKEVAFDYLRDRVAMGSRRGDLRLRLDAWLDGTPYMLRGLQFAIVDEADSVMIDEARTPLILSATPESAEDEHAAIRAAMDLASGLVEGADFRLSAADRAIDLTPEGRAAVEDGAETFPPGWRAGPFREELTRTALSALHLHRLGEHYIMRDGRVEIVDENTGRTMPDRSWAAGLHQAVEIKEGCRPTPRRETLAQTTYQRFFRRYQHLCGMTGTAREAAGEFWTTYRLPVVAIAPNRPSRRRDLGTRVLDRAEDKWRAVARRAAELAGEGRPVLIGARTVAASEAASAALAALGTRHVVLNAAQDADEATVVARAGAASAVTVATNMAGRGTDIRLDQVALACGGLHVILSERHAASRIDRQLAGRCARQGEPGSVERILSLEDDVLDQLPAWWRGLLAVWTRLTGRADAFALAQGAVERRHARARRALMRLDERLAESLSFAGPPE